MPKYKSKSKVKRGQALQNYWQLRNQRKFHSENLGKDPSTESNALHSSTTIAKTHVPFGVAVDEEIPLPDITQQQDNILPELIIEKDQPETGKRNISGRRIVDIKYFFSKLQEISNHSPYNCGVQSLKIVGEKRVGLSSKFTLECLMCKGKFLLNNIPGDLKKNTESVAGASTCKEKYIVSGDLDINTAVVAGAVSVGIGYSQLDELLSAIDLPMMTEPLYQKQHEFVSNAWEKALGQSMQEAAEEEKRIALEKGRVTTGGIPIIDVIADGCWKTLDFCTHKLFEDIQTVHLHAFGNHTNCKIHFCNRRQTETESVPADFFTSSLWQRICFIINNIADHSRSLVHDVESNIVECFHSIVAKLVGGKRVNYSLRSGYQARCSASAVTFNTKRKPTTILYKTIVGKSPKGRMSTFDNKYRKLRGLKKRANYKKPQKTCDAITQNKDYGEQSSKPDVGEDVLNLMKETFLSNLKKSKEERTWIERQTILQSESSEWLELRRSLLTASNFGKVIKMRPDTICANIVKQLLYKINIDAVPLQHGREYEKKRYNNYLCKKQWI
ncbi:unnamed protein product [Parnassius apollo]|uniref:(apollo) hypothetical protein n=1 Tax=Parnassius apollo TaxID=110799 RepID=A0A8S3WDE4_PARAO|nr:unnamed protein product [Parnassius apollo]